MYFLYCFKVREVLVPPHYEGVETAYIQDLALLALNRPTRTTEYIVPACVDWDNIYKVFNGDTLYVSITKGTIRYDAPYAID